MGKLKKLYEKTFSVKNVAGMGVFTALAFAVSFWEFPIFPAAPFFKLDFSNVFIMLGGFMYGPIGGTLILLAEQLLRLAVSSSGGVGELANFLVGFAYLIVPATAYRFYKGLPNVILTLILGCLLQILAALAANRFILFPFYGLAERFHDFFWYIAAFNAIKSVAITVLTVLLYKRVSFLFKRIHLQNTGESV